MVTKIIKTVLLAAIIFYIFYGFDFSKIDLSVISPTTVLLSSFVLFLGQIILSIRFMYIIDSKFLPALETIVVSNALNMILPARLGEAAKAVYLKKFYNYPYNVGISAVFIERFFDVIMLFLIIIGWIYFFVTEEYVKKSAIILFFFIILVLVFFNTGFMRSLVEKIPFEYPKIVYKNINSMFKKSPVLIFWSIVLWGSYLLSYYIFFDMLGFKEVVELFIVSTVALMIPLAPAGLGTFEGVVVFYLHKYGISKEDALLLASTYHFLLFAVDMIMFAVFLLLKDIKFSELKALK
jgi:uncharacterized membrane protein YbhN (UPF0104 family)